MDGFWGHHSAHHTCHEATGQSLTGLGAGSFEEAGLQDLSPGAASRTHLGSGHSGTGTRWAGLRGVLESVGFTCREPGATHEGPGLGDTVHSLGMDTSQHGRGRQAPGLRPREPRSFCCPQESGQMVTGGSHGLSDLGQSPGLLLCCLW